MTQIKLENASIADLEVIANPADLRRDIHIFMDYVRRYEIKRGHRDNQIPVAHRQRLAKLMSAPARAAQSDEYGGCPWIAHVDTVCLALKFVGYDTKGTYVGYSSTTASYPENYVKVNDSQYNSFLGLSLQAQEARLLSVHLQSAAAQASEFFGQGPLSRLDRFDSWGSATGVVPTIPFSKVRHDLLSLMAECPSGVWLSTKSLIEHLRLHDPWFLIPEHLSASVKAQAMRSGRYANFIERKRDDWGNRNSISDRDPEGFAKVEGRFLERFLEGIPLELGYVEVAYSRRNKETAIEPSRGLLPAFRVTERLRPAMRQEIAAPKVTVLPNFEVHVESLFFPPTIEAQLLPLGEITQRGIVTVFRLTKPKVASVLAANPKVSVIERLKKLSGRDLPANVQQELNEWAGHSNKFILYEGFGVLEGARDNNGAASFVVEVISANFALVRSAEKLYRHLEAAELVPVSIRHSEHRLATPAGVRSRLAPAAAPPRAPAKKPATILKRRIQITLWFPNAETHAAFHKILLDAKCVVPMDSDALTFSYSKQAEPVIKECLKKFQEHYAVTVEDIEQ